MTTAADLLPDNATPAERALAPGLHAPLPVPIRQIMDPATTPVAWLPWLAAHRGVDLWFEDWATARKRQMVAQAASLAALKGTVAGPAAFLPYVDAVLIDRVTYPTRFIVGRGVLGRTPIGHQPFVARYLVKRVTFVEPRAFVVGRAVVGRSILRTPDREPYRRCLEALRVAKAPDTQVRVDFGHKRPITIEDAPALDAGFRLDGHLSRVRL